MNAPIKPAAACATLAATLAVSLIFVSSGLAQETAAPGTVEAERVTVTGESAIMTGSLIPTSEVVGPNPIDTLDRDLINKSGQGTTTEELLKSLPIASANSIPVQNNATGAGGPPGASTPATFFSARATTKQVSSATSFSITVSRCSIATGATPIARHF